MNPYTATAGTQLETSHAGWLFYAPWATLCGLAVLTVLADVVYVIWPLVHLFTTVWKDTGFANSEIVGLPYLFGAVAVFATHLMLLYGCTCALRRRRRSVTRLTAIVSLVPVLTPLYVVGIPIAIWALFVNRRLAYVHG